MPVSQNPRAAAPCCLPMNPRTIGRDPEQEADAVHPGQDDADDAADSDRMLRSATWSAPR